MNKKLQDEWTLFVNQFEKQKCFLDNKLIELLYNLSVSDSENGGFFVQVGQNGI